MSASSVREALASFVAQSAGSVMVLTGRWGRGKTYVWQSWLRSEAGVRALRGREYRYVSLFGVETLSELKTAIAVNVVDVGEGQERSKAAALVAEGKAMVQRGLRKFAAKGDARVELPGGLGGVEFGQLVRAAMLHSVRNYVICIDDIERRGEGLRLLDVLGYIASLRDERHCAVLLILNDDALSPDDQDEFAKLREKVFDHEVRFEPTVAECADAVFPEADEQWRDVRDNCVRLGIENIRVLQRVRRTCERFHAALGPDAAGCRDWIAHSLPLLVLAHYSKEERHPTLDYVLASGIGRLMRLAEGKPLPEDRAEWQQFLNDYDFDENRVLDPLAAAYLRTGLIRPAEVEAAIGQLRVTEERRKAEEAFAQAWDLYHDSFADNTDEVLAALASSLRRCLRWISPGNVSSTTTLFRQLGRDAEADALVGEYVAAIREEAPEVLDLRTYPFADTIGDAKLREEMASAHKATVAPVPLREAVRRLVAGERWTDADGEALDRATEDDIVQLLHGLRGGDLQGAVRALLQYVARGPDHNAVRRRALKALRRIEAETDLNRQRMRRYSPLPDFPPMAEESEG